MRFAVAALFLFASAASLAAAGLDSLRAIRALSVQEAAKRLRVDVEAVVTFSGGETRPHLLVHDGEEGIYVQLITPAAATTVVQAGQRVRIEGITEPGGFLPIIDCERITVLGAGTLPEARVLGPDDLFSPPLDCQWVQASGVVTAVESGSQNSLLVNISGRVVKLILPASEQIQPAAAHLLQRPVMFRGAVGTVFNPERQLTGRHFFVPSLSYVTPVENEPPAGEPQLRKINELLRSDASSHTRVRVRGVVTHAVASEIYLRGDGVALLVRGAGAGALRPGTHVEAEGFADMAPFRPVLRATRVEPLKVGTPAAPPEPVPLDLRKSGLVHQHCELVALDADFLGRREQADGGAILQCRRDWWYFEATAPPGADLPRELAPNDRVRLTGICELTASRPLPVSGGMDGFRIHLRGAEDLAVLRRAPWWTLRRLLWALGAVAVAAIAALAWAALLRRQVAEQTSVIGSQIERAAVKDERQRIARELHDTIEQELAGLSIQLRNARQRLSQSPAQAAGALELAERMLKHCRHEARTSIHDLRSVALEQRGLLGALEELLPPLAAQCGAAFTFTSAGDPHAALSGPAAVQILRIAHEAVANAAAHAAPRFIEVQIAQEAGAVRLEVRDDGRGFDPTAPSPRGHFGLLGMRERAAKLLGEIQIESAPGQGTTVRVIAPAADPARAESSHS